MASTWIRGRTRWAEPGEWSIAEGSGAKPLLPGQGEGILYGGCLSMLVASLGTQHEIRTAGTILFIEDVAAKPYQIDRMLMQLKHGRQAERCARHGLR